MILHHLKDTENIQDPNLIVGLGTSDDAGVYKISPELALIQTVDFFTPVVDDPYTYGLVAAANSLSDIYAMGGKPTTVLNICCFTKEVPPQMLAEILRGGADKVYESGAVLLGGHTVTDNEIKYGLAVTGVVHPDKVYTNAGSKTGDVLVLTKPLGTGIISTGFKNDVIGEDEFSEAIESMSTLNKAASEAMQKVGANACTDVTGFGLAGHMYEMAAASGKRYKVNFSKLPFMTGLFELIEKDQVPGGAFANKRHFGQWVSFEDGMTDEEKIAVFDPQTSGGLLISINADKGYELVRELKLKGTLCAEIIGEVVSDNGESDKISIHR